MSIYPPSAMTAKSKRSPSMTGCAASAGPRSATRVLNFTVSLGSASNQNFHRSP